MRNENKYLLKRNDGRWHYARRAPTKYTNFDSRGYVRKGLDTTSLDGARMRRDELVKASGLGPKAYGQMVLSRRYRRYEQ